MVTVLGETNEAFYSNIYTGQALPRPMRPPRPPPPRSITTTTTTTTTNAGAINMINGPHNIDSSNINNSNNNHRSRHDNDEVDEEIDDDDDTNTNLDGGGQPWFCNMCTFQNHPLLNKCEQCDMPLLTTSGTVPQNIQSNFNSAIRNQPPPKSTQSLTQPPPFRLYQHIPYQQQSAPPISNNPFQYTTNNLVAAGGTAGINNHPASALSPPPPSTPGLNDFLPRLTQQH